MTRTFTLLLVIFLLPFFEAMPTHADDTEAASNEAKLRSALRDTMLQLRDAQGQVASLQADKTQAETDKAALHTQMDSLSSQIKDLTQQANNDKASATKMISDLNDRINDKDGQITKLNESLVEWKGAYNKAAQVAQTTEAERARLAGQVVMLQRLVMDGEGKNEAFFKLGNEILDRYESFGLGDALTAKEPFIGITRVKFQNLIQDYHDKLEAQQIIPGSRKSLKTPDTTLHATPGLIPDTPTTSTVSATPKTPVSTP